MKLCLTKADQAAAPRRAVSAMTLVEIMVALTLMGMVLAALLAANLIGLSEYQYLSAKAGASNTSRIAVGEMLRDIRMAKGYAIGNVTGTTFTSFTANSSANCVGNSIQLYPVLISTNDSIDYSKYILYAFDTSDSANNDGRLWRYTSTNGVSSVVASNLINSLCFTNESYTGSQGYSATYKSVIHTTLQFCEFVYPLTKVGTNELFDYYRIDCRATPHLPDGP